MLAFKRSHQYLAVQGAQDAEQDGGPQDDERRHRARDGEVLEAEPPEAGNVS